MKRLLNNAEGIEVIVGFASKVGNRTWTQSVQDMVSDQHAKSPNNS